MRAELQQHSIGQLKKLLRDHGVPHQDCLEKSELIARAVESGVGPAAPATEETAKPAPISQEQSLQELQRAAAEVRNNPEAGLERAKNRDTHALAALTLLSTEPTFVQRVGRQRLLDFYTEFMATETKPEMLMYAHPPLSNLGSDPEGRAVVWQAILRKDPQLLAKNFRLLRSADDLKLQEGFLILIGNLADDADHILPQLERSIPELRPYLIQLVDMQIEPKCPPAEPRAVPELKDTLQRVAGYCLHNYIYCPQTRAELARDKSVIERLIKRLIVVANQHKERPLPQDCRMSPVYSLITVLSHMCQEGDSARYMGQVGGLPLVKALRDWMRCQDKDISESSLGFCGNLTIEGNIANVWRAHVLDTILPVLARPTPVRKTAVFLLSKMVLDFAMTARYVRPGSDMYDRVCKLSEEAERLGDSELQQVLANILQTARAGSDGATKMLLMCAGCEETETRDQKKFKVCSACRTVRYCSVECQRRHWPKHKRECVKAEKTPLGSGRPASHVPSTWVSHNLPMLMQKALQMRIHYTDMVIVLDFEGLDPRATALEPKMNILSFKALEEADRRGRAHELLDTWDDTKPLLLEKVERMREAKAKGDRSLQCIVVSHNPNSVTAVFRQIYNEEQAQGIKTFFDAAWACLP